LFFKRDASNMAAALDKLFPNSLLGAQRTTADGMWLTLKTVNDELRRLGNDVHFEKGDGSFYFWKGDANNWRS
jgi:hypothetical protein